MQTINLKIVDQEYIFMEKVVLVYLDTLQTVGKDYCRLLEEISEYALDVPVINKRLTTLSEVMQDIVDSLSTIASALKGSASSFVLSVDETDDFLY
jgi:predicted site-specific integrase-resolvase